MSWKDALRSRFTFPAPGISSFVKAQVVFLLPFFLHMSARKALVLVLHMAMEVTFTAQLVYFSCISTEWLQTSIVWHLYVAGTPLGIYGSSRPVEATHDIRTGSNHHLITTYSRARPTKRQPSFEIIMFIANTRGVTITSPASVPKIMVLLLKQWPTLLSVFPIYINA